MLNYEEYIKNDREQSQAKLGRVSKNGNPIIIVIGIQYHLQHAQDPACKVQEYVSNTPANCGLSFVIHVGLEIVTFMNTKHKKKTNYPLT